LTFLIKLLITLKKDDILYEINLKFSEEFFMKIKLLGTGAAEGIPAFCCKCPVCLEAEEIGGKEIRRRYHV
jgi:hypothetical protein